MKLHRILLSISVAVVLSGAPGASAQSASHGGGKAWTVSAIFGPNSPLQSPPRLYLWRPKSDSVTYLRKTGEHGRSRNLVSVDAPNGEESILIPASKLTPIYSEKNGERDRAHRMRYGTPSYHWSPDGQSILFDSTGTLWLYTFSRGTAVKVGDSGSGGGDDPKFSPDGKSISFIRDHNLQVMPVSGGHTRALTSTSRDTILNGQVDWVYREELDVRSNYFWSPDSKRIVYLQMDEAAVPEYPIVDWIPNHSTVYRQRYPEPGDPNPEVRVGIVPATGGATRWLNVPLSEGNDYIPRFGWIDNNHIWIEVLSRDQRNVAIYFADADTGAIHEAFSETEQPFFGDTYDVDFLTRRGEFLWESWRDGHTHLYLYAYDKENPLARRASLVRQVTHGDWEVLGVAGVDRRQGIVYYTSNETDPRQQMLWEIHLDGTGKKLLSRMPGVHRVSFSPDVQNYVDTASSLMEPPAVSICAVAGRCARFWNSPLLKGYTLVRPETFTAQASDGTVLYGELLLPPDMHVNASVPLIVNPYGGPGVQTVRDVFGGAPFLFDQLLMQHGFAVLHVDNRGMGNRGRAFAKFADRNFGPVQLSDQLAVLDEMLKRHPQLDPKRLGWWGWSWGGSFTLYAMTHSSRFRVGVAVAPVTNWRLYDSIYTERYLGLPAKNERVYREDSVVNSAARLKGELLLVQGTGDDNVHMQNSIQMVQGFVDADIPYRLLLYPRKTHEIFGSKARIHLFRAILRQFETNLMSDSSPKNKGN
jgi:dipeptidyl-peptidase-4